MTDVTSAYTVLNVQGPRSRELLSKVSPADFSNDAFPYLTSREIELGYGFVRANRVTFFGELGWELWVPTELAEHVYETILAAGDGLGLRHAGYHALNSLRLEKAYRLMGYDMSDEDTPLEAGLGFTVAWDKPGGFIGRDALLRRRDEGLSRRLVVLTFDDPEPLAYGNEPIWRNGTIVGRTTTAWYGHTVGRAVALGYVNAGSPGEATRQWLLDGRYEIELATVRYPVTVSLKGPYDPDNLRIKAEEPSPSRSR